MYYIFYADAVASLFVRPLFFSLCLSIPSTRFTWVFVEMGNAHFGVVDRHELTGILVPKRFFFLLFLLLIRESYFGESNEYISIGLRSPHRARTDLIRS